MVKKLSIAILSAGVLLAAFFAWQSKKSSPGFHTAGKSQARDYAIFHKTVPQPVDHFSAYGSKFRQNVDVLIPEGASSASPVFFHLGYEHDLSDRDLVALYKAYGQPSDVIFMQAEHRGYGQSVTDDEDQSAPSYVRIRQALADYHRVIVQLRTEYTGPWMAAGYSYGGGLSINFAHQYPGDIRVVLSSSGVVDWPFMMSAYDRKVRLIFKEDEYRRLAGHIRNLEPAVMFDNNWLEREFLIAGIHGMSQYARFKSMLPYFNLMSRLPTPLFMKLLHWIDDGMAKGEGWGYALANAKKSHTRAEALTGRYGWRVWRYQQCSETGIFEISAGEHGIFTRGRSDFVDECESLFGHAPESAVRAWSPRSFIKDLKVPLVYVSGGMDPWEELGVRRDYPIKRGRYFFVPEGRHCPERDDVELGKQVLSEMVRFARGGK
jgi:pimeloyl-ACP methyl ester carboxylesterase